jgi:hypothetical protein
MTVVAALALTSRPALAGPRFWTNERRETLLRDVKSTPNENQPDAVEFVNNGNIMLKTSGGLINPTITCKEIEFGGAVLSNTEAVAKVTVASGVAEGDECTDENNNRVRMLFDTLVSGAVGNVTNGDVATFTVSGEKSPFTATMNDLSWSFNDPWIGSSIWCTASAGGITAEVTNSKGPFVEEAGPNLQLKFQEAPVSVAGTGCWTAMKLTGQFVLETASNAPETAWVG